jgi:hypothetical protein
MKSAWISPPPGEILSFPSLLNILPRIAAFKSHPLAGTLDFVSDVHICPLEGECQPVSDRYQADVYPGVGM